MPTSAIGRSEAGFTLVELMVVLAIVGLLSAAVVLAMPDEGGSLDAEALRFAARARAAQEWAVMDNRPIAVVLAPGGYRFERRGGGRWQAMDGKAFVETRWKDGTRARLEGGGDRIVFDSTGFAEAARLTLSRGARQAGVEFSDGGRIHVLQ